MCCYRTVFIVSQLQSYSGNVNVLKNDVNIRNFNISQNRDNTSILGETIVMSVVQRNVMILIESWLESLQRFIAVFDTVSFVHFIIHFQLLMFYSRSLILYTDIAQPSIIPLQFDHIAASCPYLIPIQHHTLHTQLKVNLRLLIRRTSAG